MAKVIPISHRTSRRNAIINRFKKHKPQDYRDVERLGLELMPLGTGAYRTVYKIKGSDLVVKFPLSFDKDNLVHGEEEWKAVANIKRCRHKYAAIVDMMPEMYYHDKESGVTLMRYYKPMKGPLRDTVELLVDKLMATVYTTDGGDADAHAGNIGLTEDNAPILIDLGYFTKRGRTYSNW